MGKSVRGINESSLQGGQWVLWLNKTDSHVGVWFQEHRIHSAPACTVDLQVISVKMSKITQEARHIKKGPLKRLRECSPGGNETGRCNEGSVLFKDLTQSFSAPSNAWTPFKGPPRALERHSANPTSFPLFNCCSSSFQPCGCLTFVWHKSKN